MSRVLQWSPSSCELLFFLGRINRRRKLHFCFSHDHGALPQRVLLCWHFVPMGGLRHKPCSCHCKFQLDLILDPFVFFSRLEVPYEFACMLLSVCWTQWDSTLISLVVPAWLLCFWCNTLSGMSPLADDVGIGIYSPFHTWREYN